MTALGVSLLFVGALVILIEAHVPTLGIIGTPGVIMLGAGAVLAVAGLGGGVVLGVLAALVLIAIGAGVVAISVSKGRTVRRLRIRTGAEGLIGHLGVVRTWGEPDGSVLVDGALWRARQSLCDEEPMELHVGDTVVVERLNGLTLSVRPAEEWELVR